MRPASKIALATLATLVLLPVVAFLAYDSLVFQPRQSEVQALLDHASPGDRNPPESIRRFILASHVDGVSPSSHVARLLLVRLNDPRGKGTLYWHASSALWTWLVSLHMSQEKVLALYCTLSFNGQGFGLSDLSQRLYSKPLSALSDSEAATVAAVVWAPSYYLHNKESLERRRDALLARSRQTG